ncbi:MAG: His-Xaa-Ser system protein HxsD [Candidatus Dactylopiibacterium sp.]|nr:His-Xaa-Ser system protein HxsD [Candidatus Dactylopiibacterium sp.]
MESRVIDFDARVYSLMTVEKACHRFSNQASFEIRLVAQNDTSVVHVTISMLAGKSDIELTRLVQHLYNEALDQQLREQIRAQTEGVRNLILAHAFSRSGLIAADGTLVTS